MADLFGKINRTIIPIEYTGVDTETAQTIVDNEKKTIEVNVLASIDEGAVRYDVAQELTEEEKQTARENIGANNAYIAGDNITISDGVISATDTTYAVATTSQDGLMPQLASQNVQTQTQDTKFLREDGTWQAPSYTQATTYSAGTGININDGIISNTGVAYLTTAPTQANTSGDLKIVLLNAEPANKYAGYIYFIQ